MTIFDGSGKVAGGFVATVTTTAAALTATQCRYAILNADDGNASDIYLKSNNGTAVTTANATHRLAAGKSIAVPMEDLSQLQAIAGAGSLTLRVITFA